LTKRTKQAIKYDLAKICRDVVSGLWPEMTSMTALAERRYNRRDR